MCRSRENLSLFGTSGAIQLGKTMKEGKERRYHMLQLQWGTCEETCEWWLCRFAVPLAMLTMIIIIMTPTILISMYISIIIIITIITHRLSIPSWQMCHCTIYPQRPQRHRKHIPQWRRLRRPGCCPRYDCLNVTSSSQRIWTSTHRQGSPFKKDHWRFWFVCWTWFFCCFERVNGDVFKARDTERMRLDADVIGCGLNCNTFNSIRIFYIFLQALNCRRGWTTRPKRRSWMKQALLTDGWRNRNLKRSSFIGGMKGAWMSTNKLIKRYAITNRYS